MHFKDTEGIVAKVSENNTFSVRLKVNGEDDRLRLNVRSLRLVKVTPKMYNIVSMYIYQENKMEIGTKEYFFSLIIIVK